MQNETPLGDWTSEDVLGWAATLPFARPDLALLCLKGSGLTGEELAREDAKTLADSLFPGRDHHAVFFKAVLLLKQEYTTPETKAVKTQLKELRHEHWRLLTRLFVSQAAQ
jgi:hypothetical protein